MKKVFALLLSVAMVICMMPSMAFAATVTSVEVSPTTAEVAKGGTKTFTATVKDENGATMDSETVTWEVSGGVAGTSITDGELTVAADETATSLTVTATASDNTTKGTTTVTVIEAHTHVFDQEVKDAKYLKSAADCTNDAVYFKSCECGEKGPETFTVADSALGHDTTAGAEWGHNATKHWKVCKRCGVPVTETEAAHELNGGDTCECGYDQTHTHSSLTKVDAVAVTCTTDGNKEYYTCSCGMWFEDEAATTAIDDHTSVVLKATGHDFSGAWLSDENEHWHKCKNCDVLSAKEAHVPGAAATASTPQTCTVCGYEIAPATGGGGGGSYVPIVTDPLPTTKTESTNAVQNYVKPADYEDAEAAEIKAIMDKAAEDIKNAKTAEEVKAIEAAAKAEIDKLETAEEKAVIRTVEATKFKATSKNTKLNGKKAIKITWTVPAGMEFDGFEVFRSTKQYSGFGKKPFFTTTKQQYTNNKDLKTGKTYYYKVRAYKYVNDEKVYTEYSFKAIRTVK